MLHDEGPSFLSEVWSRMTYETFAPETPVVRLAERADRLIVVVGGERCACIHPHRRALYT